MAPVRKNGLTPPYSTMQIGTWVTLPTLMVQFLFFCSPILPLAASIPCTLVFFALGFASAYYGYAACVTDPVDHRLACHWADHGGPQCYSTPSPAPTGFLALFYTAHSPGVTTKPDDGPTKYCWVCETDVAEHAMHCKYCNKCVSHFDHHCQWLNTCVGEANYKYFYGTLWSITAFLFVHIAIMIGLVVDIFVGGSSEQRGKDWFGSGLPEFVAAVNLLFIVFDGIAFSLIIQLLAFHITLKREGLSTYKYILRDNQRKRDKAKVDAARRARRIVDIAEAKRARRSCLVMKLRFGDLCRMMGCTRCDPLQDDEIEIPSIRGDQTANANQDSHNDEEEEEKEGAQSKA